MARGYQRTPGVPSGANASYLSPSGDTSGNTDTTVLNAALLVKGRVVLAPGNWYVHNLGMVTDDVWLQGSGQATKLNIIAGQTGITLTGPGRTTISDLSLVGGAYGIVVNGAYDAYFRNLWLTGMTSGGVKINGDLATEQHWSDVVLRGVGGVGFDLQRTTFIYTGSLYLDRVRLVQPPSTAPYGFRFTSTSGSASLNIAFLTQCVADNYTGEACYVNNCAQVFVSESWFAINGSSPAGSAALHITGGFQQSYNGNYTYSGLVAPSVKVDGNAKGIDIGGGHVFDGTPTTVAVGLASATNAGALQLGSYQSYCGGGLTDTPTALTPKTALPGYNGAAGEETFHRLFCNSTPALASGTLFLSFFTACKTEVISTIECMTNNAASGTTYAGMGLFTVAANGTLTLVAKGEATTLFQSAFQPVGGFDTKIGIGTYTKQAGQRYAVGVLWLGTTAPNLIGANASSGTPGSNLGVASSPLGPLAALKTGQSTLGTVGTQTHTAASLTGSGGVPYFVIR